MTKIASRRTFSHFRFSVLTALLAIFILSGCTSNPVLANGDDDDYHAYWLIRKDVTETDDYVPILLTRGPPKNIDFRSIYSARDSGYDAKALLAFLAVRVMTYMKDSLWNIDGNPFKPACCVESVNVLDGTLVQALPESPSQIFYLQRTPLANVVRILEHPEGTIPIARLYSPTAGAEDYIQKLLPLLKAQISRLGDVNPPGSN